ncbi:helix-turn-helix domain-containing protein [Bacteroides acidifaciens]|uniref:helix-turn-helix domain-containing protein n=1 Tax=Bacteroides acidifaciens TaxID=85831 RepID=UPI003C6C1792
MPVLILFCLKKFYRTAIKGNIELSLIEAKLLKELIVNVGHTVDASTMMQLIWQRDDPYSRNSLHGFIHKLRHYLLTSSLF